jgi:hypothetical protein
MLRSVEDIFGLDHLAFAAQDGLKEFGDDVFNAPAGFPAGPPSGGPPAVRLPRIKIRIGGVPRRCVTGRFKARVSISATYGLGRARVSLDRRALKRSARRKFRVRVNAAHLRSGRHRLTVKASDRLGNAARRTVVFKRC